MSSPFAQTQASRPGNNHVYADHVVYMAEDAQQDSQSSTEGTNPVCYGGVAMGHSDDTKEANSAIQSAVDDSANFEEQLSPYDRRFQDAPRETSNIRHLWNWILRSVFLIAPIGIIFAIPMIIYDTSSYDSMIGKERIFWLFVWLEVSWVSFWVSLMAVDLFPFMYRFVMGFINPCFRKYWSCLKALRFPLALTIWGVVSLIMFDVVVKTNSDLANGDRSDWQITVLDVMAILTFWALGSFIVTLVVLFLRIHYQNRSLVLKTTVSKEHVWALALLYEASRALVHPFSKVLKSEDVIIDAANFPVAGGFHQAPARAMYNTTRWTDSLVAFYGKVVNRHPTKQWLKPTSPYSVVIKALESDVSSEALGRRIWRSFTLNGHKTLVLANFTHAFGPHRRADAEKCFQIFDQNENGDLHEDEMLMSIVETGRIRPANIQGLSDMNYAIKTFDYMLQFVVAIVMILWLVIEFAPIPQTILNAFQFATVGLSFAMSRTINEFAACSIFLFLKHPYDVGDRLDLWNKMINKSEPLVVERISLLYTVFKRTDNGKLFQCPNFILNARTIENITRSGANKEQVELSVDFNTTFKDLTMLRNELSAFVGHLDNIRDYCPDPLVDIVGIQELSKLEVRIEIKYKSNWSNGPLRSARRSKFMCALVAILRRIPIARPDGIFQRGSEGKPNYTVNISEAEAEALRANTTRELLQMRGDYRAQPLQDRISSHADTEADDTLNSRTPFHRDRATREAEEEIEAAAMLKMMSNAALPASNSANPPRIGVTMQPPPLPQASLHTRDNSSTGISHSVQTRPGPGGARVVNRSHAAS